MERDLHRVREDLKALRGGSGRGSMKRPPHDEEPAMTHDGLHWMTMVSTVVFVFAACIILALSTATARPTRVPPAHLRTPTPSCDATRVAAVV
jgi:hypothetical protein